MLFFSLILEKILKLMKNILVEELKKINIDLEVKEQIWIRLGELILKYL